MPVVDEAPIACPAEADCLRIVAFNVWSGLDYLGLVTMGEWEDDERRRARTRLLVDGLRALDPDVVGMGEVNPLPRRARWLGRELGMDHASHRGVSGVRIGPVGLPTNLREGDALLVAPEHGLGKRCRKQLSGGPVGRFASFHFADATQVVGGRIAVGGREVWVFTTHWHATTPFEIGSEGRSEEARRLVRFVDRRSDGAPVVVMGDLNALPGSPELDVLVAAGFRDAWTGEGGATWDEVGNPNIRMQGVSDPPRQDRIDFVFVRGLETLRAAVVFDAPVDGLFASDHYAVLADVALGMDPPSPP